MHKIHKSEKPEWLNEASENTWDSFRSEDRGEPYKALKAQIFQDQFYCCAYCEQKISEEEKHKQRIEHFYDKSESPEKQFCWNNLIGVCEGNSRNRNVNYPNHLHCDSYKNELKRIERDFFRQKNWLNPLELDESIAYFKIDLTTGAFIANDENCNEIKEKTLNTIKAFNLNSYILCVKRADTIRLYFKTIKQKIENKDLPKEAEAKAFIDEWIKEDGAFTKVGFLTTRRLCPYKK